MSEGTNDDLCRGEAPNEAPKPDGDRLVLLRTAGAIYGRAGDMFSSMEIYHAGEIVKRPEWKSELLTIEAWHNSEVEAGSEFVHRTLESLLGNWQKCLDKGVVAAKLKTNSKQKKSTLINTWHSKNDPHGLGKAF